PTQPHVEERQEERDGCRSVIARVGIGRGSRYSHRRAYLDSFLVSISFGRCVAILCQILVAGREVACFSIDLRLVVTAVKWREDVRSGFPFLPGEKSSAGQVQGAVQDRVGSAVDFFGELPFVSVISRAREVPERQVIVIVEADEGVGLPVR